MGQSTAPLREAEDGRKANMYVTLGLMVGRGSKMSYSSMQSVYSCKKYQLLNPGFSSSYTDFQQCQ